MVVLAGLVLAGLAARPAEGGEPGRRAEIHLTNGSVVRCVLLDFAAGAFHVRTQGTRESIPFADVDRVVFGPVVGVREEEMFRPPPEEELTGPAPPRPRDPLEKAFGRANPQQVFRWLGLLTERFTSREKTQRIQERVAEGLRAAPAGSEANRNLRIADAILKTADDDLRGAKQVLDELRKDYPDDIWLAEIAPPMLKVGVERWRNPGALRPPRRRMDPRPGNP